MTRSNSDPASHRQAERRFIEHVERLLTDERLRVDTTRGRRPVTSLMRNATRSDKSVDVKRAMTEAGKPDRELEAQMPVGEAVEVELAQRKLLFFREVVGRVRVLCVSPVRGLLGDSEVKPLTKQETEKLLSGLPFAGNVPSTVVILSTAGFAIEAHELAERRADRTTVLVEPNGAGGYSVYGPVETKSLNDLFDPEAEDEKRERVRAAIADGQGDLTGSGIASDRLATRTQLPIQLVETELREYARQNAGLVAKRLDGRVVLFREGSVPNAAGASASAGGGDMPLIDRLKTLFGRKGEHEKKIAFLSERRAALGQQRDRAYEDIETLERKDADLRQQFKDATSELSKRRLTSQILQLRKDMERRQQLLGVLNQQMNVISTDLHNIELVNQGKVAQLPDSEEIANNAAAAEEVLAQLEADTELATSAAGGMTTMGMSAEEQALYDELQRESGITEGPAVTPPASAAPAKADQTASGKPVRTPITPERTESKAGERGGRTEAEPG